MSTTSPSSRPRCACGRAMSKHSQTCNTCHKQRMDALLAQARAIVATGKCPTCGTPLVRNLSLAGWYQCGALGETNMREAAYRSLPSCSFQTFTQ